MNILVAINDNYCRPLQTMLLSLAKTNREHLDIYLMSSELSEKNVIRLKNYIRKNCHGTLHIIEVSKDFLKNAPIGNHFSKEMYYRIFCSIYLPNHLDKILWLDADIIVIKEISDLYGMDFMGCSIVACEERLGEGQEEMARACNLRLGRKEDQRYFNSGVMLFNLDKIRKQFSQDQILQLIDAKKEILVSPDQDILNLIYEDDVIFADSIRFNYQVHYDWWVNDEQGIVNNQTCILHYIGPWKPWKPKNIHFTFKYYWKIRISQGYIVEWFVHKLLSYIIIAKVKMIRGGIRDGSVGIRS